MPYGRRAVVGEFMVGTTARMIDAMLNPAVPTRKRAAADSTELIDELKLSAYADLYTHGARTRGHHRDLVRARMRGGAWRSRCGGRRNTVAAWDGTTTPAARQ
ncbi:hypothetical protein [Micromonospora sp. URMC 103]|uniref:hypothetical protein n=1 Tax=Micromonospora sp. URMC 103 TaxID=3423406 RepID=UPI003F1A1D31